MSNDAERLRAQIPTSTDPDRLEREAREAERRQGYRFACAMPGDGPWHYTQYEGNMVISSPVHGVFRLEISADRTSAEWVKVDVWKPPVNI